MDFKEVLDKLAEQEKAKHNQGRITLGGIIQKLELEGIPKDALTYWDSELVMPTCDGYHSNRGNYRELGIGFEAEKYDNHFDLAKFLESLKSQIGKTYEGWKGGDFTMDENSYCALSNEGITGKEIWDLDIKKQDYVAEGCYYIKFIFKEGECNSLIPEHEKSAKEMFEELGYYLQEKTSESYSYLSKQKTIMITITPNLQIEKTKFYQSIGRHSEWRYSAITILELNAITQQLKELRKSNHT